MTTDRFIARHGKEWEILKGDLIELLDSLSPAHDADNLPLAVTVEQSTVLNANFTYVLQGYAKARRKLKDLGGDIEQPPEESATFEKSTEQIFREEAVDTIFPPMPVPKGRRKK
jgi:hypothetical protein